MGAISCLLALHCCDQSPESLVCAVFAHHLSPDLGICEASQDDVALHPLTERDIPATSACLSQLAGGGLSLHSGGEGSDELVPVLLHGQECICGNFNILCPYCEELDGMVLRVSGQPASICPVEGQGRNTLRAVGLGRGQWAWWPSYTPPTCGGSTPIRMLYPLP